MGEVHDMKPSDIYIRRGPLPLTNTFGKAEAEQAAGVMISVMAGSDDEWRSVSLDEMSEYVKANVDMLAHNPFYRPAPAELVVRGLAAWTDGCVEFTTEGLDALRGSQWNRAGGSNG